MMYLIDAVLSNITTEILEAELNDDSKEAAVTIGGYIAKKLTQRSKCSVCHLKLISAGKHIANDNYRLTLSRGGLICPSPSLSNFVCHSFSILDLINPMLQKYSQEAPIKIIAERTLQSIQWGIVDFTCEEHQSWGDKFATQTVINIFYNNEQKLSNDRVRKDQIKDFKIRQRSK